MRHIRKEDGAYEDGAEIGVRLLKVEKHHRSLEAGRKARFFPQPLLTH